MYTPAEAAMCKHKSKPGDTLWSRTVTRFADHGAQHKFALPHARRCLNRATLQYMCSQGLRVEASAVAVGL